MSPRLDLNVESLQWPRRLESRSMLRSLGHMGQVIHFQPKQELSRVLPVGLHSSHYRAGGNLKAELSGGVTLRVYLGTCIGLSEGAN
jgi:hypothetical protein